MSWIRSVSAAEARARHGQLDDCIPGVEPLDNIRSVHGLRPQIREDHLAHYRSFLHRDGNSLPRWQLKLVGVYESLLNACEYCVERYCQGLVRLPGADASGRHRVLLERDEDDAFPCPPGVMPRYAAVLTRMPSASAAAHIAPLRANGRDDGQILELNQVSACCNYANRTVLGLGSRLESAPGPAPGG